MTNLVVKVLTCLIVPLYHTMQANIQPELSYSPLRYWVMMSGIFFTELVLDMLKISSTFTIIQLLLIFWCVAPIDGVAGLYTFDQVFEPVLKISQNIFCDAIKNKVMDDMLEAAQQLLKTISECASNWSFPSSKRSVICQFLDFWKELGHRNSDNKVTNQRLFSDLYKNLTNCEINLA